MITVYHGIVIANGTEVVLQGDHTLEVGVTYLTHGLEHPRAFRKMYNFTTFDTIGIRSMSLPFSNRSVLFQMHIENTGDTPIHISAVRFLAESSWDVQSCNELVKDEELGIFGERLLAPRDVFQTMHVLVPKKGFEGEMPFALGKVEIEWVGSMGERGSSVTGLMKRRLVVR